MCSTLVLKQQRNCYALLFCENPNPMKILLINKFFYEKGGAERSFFSTADELSKRGHSIIYFSMKHPDNLESPYAEYFVDQVDFYKRFSPMQMVVRGISFIRSHQAALRIKKLISETKPHIAHLHNIYHQITPSIIPVLKRGGIPVVMTLHDYKLICPNYSLLAHGEFCFRCKGGRFYRAALTRCRNGSFRDSALLAAEAYWQKISGVYDLVDYFVAPSKYLRGKLIEDGFDHERIMYIPNFVPPLEGGKEDKSSLLTESLPEKFVLFSGRLCREKGVHILLDALKLVPHIKAVICGDGPMMQELRDNAKMEGMSNVQFTGFVEKAALENVIKRSYLVVQPSLFPDNAPFSVLEAAALGKTVLASDVGGLPEMIEKLGGVSFHAGSASQLAMKMSELWDDEEKARSIGEEEAGRALEHYGRARHVDALEELYGRVLGKNLKNYT